MNLRPISDRLGRFLIWKVFSPEGEERPREDGVSDRERRELYAEEDFLHHFEKKTKVYGAWGIFVPLFLLLGDVLFCGVVPNILPGVLMELVGAWALAQALFVGPADMRNISSSGYGGISPPFRRALAMDAADGICGIVLLVLGTIWQSLATVGIGFSLSRFCWLPFFI